MGTVNKDKVSEPEQQTSDSKVLDGGGGKLIVADEPVLLDPTLKYVDPAKPDEVLTYDVMRGRINRGAMFDKTQSDLQKEQNDHKLTKERADKAEWRAELAEQNQRISRIENPEDNQDDDYDDNNDQGIPAARIVRQIEPELKKRDSRTEAIEKEVAHLKQINQEQAEKEEYRQRQDLSTKASMVMLEKEFPDLKKSELETIIMQEQLADFENLEALIAPTRNEGLDRLKTSKVYASAAVKLRVAATIKQEAETKRQEMQRRVETSSSSGRKEVVISQSPTKNKDEIAQRNKETQERARKNAEDRENARKGLG